jgi:hypothetical protein
MIDGFINALTVRCSILDGRVFGSVELSNATPTAMRMPCAFVVPMSEKAEPNTLINGYSQRVTAQVGVVICVKNIKNDKGMDAQFELEAVRNEVKAALCGFEDVGFAPIDFVAGQLAAYDAMHLRWNDIFTTQFYYRK